MENIRDWAYRAQRWWGNGYPSGLHACNELNVSVDDPSGCPKCGGLPAAGIGCLDTGSLGAVAFQLLRWPDKTPDLTPSTPRRFSLPGFDILFFWVARMIMMGLKFRGRALP